jgi:hypothetical protein
VAGVAAGDRIAENMNLAIFDIDYPVVSNTSLSIDFVFNFTVCLEGGISYFYY